MNTITAKGTLVLSVFLGGSSLVLFLYFLFFGPIFSPWLGMDTKQILFWDAFLSVLFFAQHSLMVRQSVRKPLTRLLPDALYPAFYSLVSGGTLIVTLLFWQRSSAVILALDGIGYWAARALALSALAGFVWEVVSLGSLFDPFGLNPVRTLLSGKTLSPPQFILLGPYRYVRHPLYSLMIVLIWSMPLLTADRLVFNGLWTIWMIVAIQFEERDLIRTFGDQYLRYRATVPMLIPRFTGNKTLKEQ